MPDISDPATPWVRLSFTLPEARALLTAGEVAIDVRATGGLAIPAPLRIGVLRLRDALGGA